MMAGVGAASVDAIWGIFGGATNTTRGWMNGGIADSIYSAATSYLDYRAVPVVGPVLAAELGALDPDVQAGVAALLGYGKTGQLNPDNAKQLAAIMADGAPPSNSNNQGYNDNPDHRLLQIDMATWGGPGTETVFSTIYSYHIPQGDSHYLSILSVNAFPYNYKGAIPSDHPFVNYQAGASFVQGVQNPSYVGGIAGGGKSTAFNAGGNASLDGNNGSFTLNANGTFSYQARDFSTLPIGSHPSDSFTFSLVNINEGTPSTFDIVLNRAPVASNVDVVVTAGHSMSAQASQGVLAKAIDLDGDTVSVSAINGDATAVGKSVAGTYGHITLAANGSYTYIADNVAAINAGRPRVLNDVFDITVDDGHNGTGTSSLTVHIGPLARNDLTRDGTSDILFRGKEGGDLGYYQMQNGTLEGWHSIGTSSAAYLIAGTGDFNGDGTGDILFRNNNTGDVGCWQMQNGTLEGWHAISASSTDYQVTGIGDFNGDGTSDILFRNSSSGDVGYWQMQNGVLEGWHSVGRSSTDYQAAGIGDFNGDGTSDILFRNNSTGDVGYWQMQNGTLEGWHTIGKASAAYLITGIGDFNGDGTSDILFRNNSTGDVGDWQMKNGTLEAWQAISGSSTAYQVAGTGDYNGDGTSDILFRDATGDLGYWQMQNGTLQSWQHIGGSSPAYGVVG
ncbi:FG-GAP-like repeat-containing protein [Methylobacterium sp. Gmos1]